MCLIFFGLNTHPDYKLIVAGNRDEFYNRKTAPAEFWNDSPNLLAGRDLEAMGTWLGITRTGKISMLTNFRDPKNINPNAPSRGKLVSDYLISKQTPAEYINTVSAAGKSYNGFNLLTGTSDEMWYYSNYGPAPQKLGDGYYGLSNHLLNTPWPKIEKGKRNLREYFTRKEPDLENFFQLLYDSETAPDNLLPDTGLDIDRERALSSMFIKTAGYGSRCSTLIYVDRHNKALFAERVFDTATFAHSTRKYEFDITPE